VANPPNGATIVNTQVGKAAEITMGNVAYSYYDNGRVFQATDAAGNPTTFEYNLYRRRTIVTDERGNQTGYDYDTSGHSSRITYADHTSEANVWGPATIGSGQTAQNLLLYHIDPSGIVTSYTYVNDGSLGDVHTATEGHFNNLQVSSPNHY